MIEQAVPGNFTYYRVRIQFHKMTFKDKPLLLENDNIYLRQLRTEDITDEYVDGLNDPEVNKYLLTVRQHHQTLGSVKMYINSNFESTNSILFGLFLKEDPKPFVGTVHVSGIDFYHYFAGIGICLFAKRAWGKGYALQSIMMTKEYLFESLGLHYLYAGVFTKNTKSVTLFNNGGFSESYRMKDKYRHIDSFEEGISFAAVNPSFDMLLLNSKNLDDEV